MWVSTFIVLFLCTVSAARFSDCDSNLGTLEKALYETGNNLFELNRVFYPPSLLTTRFIRVNYSFVNGENELDTCINDITYIWAVGEVLFLQPPTLFKINSLFFYYPNNELTTLSLQLPVECIGLINGTDGECSCMNDSFMLDILTQQLNIYAKFTAQVNVQRSNTFARAICAGELYDIYYSGTNHDINYIIAAATIAGPVPLLMVVMAFVSFGAVTKLCKYKKEKQVSLRSILRTTKRKNMVALASVGIYVSIYILILDIMAAHIVRTSDHEYAAELTGRSPSFNMVVAYSTLACDFLFCIAFLVIPLTIILIIHYRWQRKSHGTNLSKRRSGIIERIKHEDGKDLISFVFPLLLVAPVMCVTSHLGYIVLAWITQPSKSTTTLILYYFLFFYLYLIFRKSYKLLLQLLVKDNPPKEKSESPPKKQPTDKIVDIDHDRFELLGLPRKQSQGQSKEQPSPGAIIPGAIIPGAEQSDHANKSKPAHGINVRIFILNLSLGIVYLGLAVIFTMVVYLMPLASEDLFSYLFNVIQFMIVVVSTQFAYKLLAGKKFSLRRVIKHIKNVTDEKKYKSLLDYGEPDLELTSENVGIVEETGDFLVKKILIPHMSKNKDYYKKTPN